MKRRPPAVLPLLSLGLGPPKFEAEECKRDCPNLDEQFTYCDRYDENLEYDNGAYQRCSACLEEFS